MRLALGRDRQGGGERGQEWRGGEIGVGGREDGLAGSGVRAPFVFYKRADFLSFWLVYENGGIWEKQNAICVRSGRIPNLFEPYRREGLVFTHEY